MATLTLAIAAIPPAGGCAGAASRAATSAAGAKPAEGKARVLSADDLVLDYSPAAEVLQLWNAGGAVDPERARAVARGIPYRTLREFLTTQMRCVPSDAEVAGTIVDPSTPVCGFALQPAYKDRAALDSLLYALVARNTPLRARVARDVAGYVPANAWMPIRVWFVIASRWMFDAVTLDRGIDQPTPVVLFNLSEALGYGDTTEERAETVERVIAHETFHAALRQIEYGPPGWFAYHEPRNAFDHIARVMLDEGVAHYIDWKGRPRSDTLFTAKPGARERKAFDQLRIACKRLGNPATDPDARGEILGLASTGPLWSKYGAISGMFAAWRIERAWGADSLRGIVEEGPKALLRGYAALAAGDTSLIPLAKEMIVK